jgi:tetratricopeptide (TPR) repeat protein
VVLNNLGDLYNDQGQYAQAEPLFERALTINEKALGPDHPDVATSLENLAALYRVTKRDKEAETLEKRAARIRAIQR